MLEIRTPRLRLVEASLPMLVAEGMDRREFARLLKAKIPAGWPPPLNDEGSRLWMIDQLTKQPPGAGWAMWYFTLIEAAGDVAIGNGGFKGEPAGGIVEVGYSVMPEFQRRGYAFEAVGALIDWAFDHSSVRGVVGETLPDLVASQGVLRKLGFERVEGASAPGIWRYERLRSAS